MTKDLEIAKQCATKMQANDDCLDLMGITVLPIQKVGEAKCSLVVTDKMTNGYDICFGGVIFSLADIAFAYSCNAYNNITVAQHCDITFIRPAVTGDTLSAHAVEVNRGKRSGIYDVTVRNQDNKVVAEFRGNSSALGKPILEQG